jgi:pimeloyl-ACP methyl ester carboxylesterase
VRAALPAVSFTRFDYRGRGASSGRLGGTDLATCIDDALAILDGVTDPAERLLVVGSSMGGLVALHLALLRPRRVAGLVLLAPAVGFAARRWARLGDAPRAALLAGGRVSLETGLKDDDVGLHFYTAAAAYDLPDAPGSVPVRCPVRILHGGCDTVVPLDVSEALVGQLASADVALRVVEGAAHALTDPGDIEILLATVERMVSQLEAPPAGATAKVELVRPSAGAKGQPAAVAPPSAKAELALPAAALRREP